MGIAGTRIGPYEIQAELGRGGMGVVYRARQLSLNRDVALKVLPSNPLLPQESLERFLREGAAVAQVTHPHIVQVYDVGEAEGIRYIAMELVTGGSVAQRLEKGEAFSYRDAAQVALQIAGALGVLHAKGMVHRDIKPSNILLMGEDLSAKLTDFGVALLQEQPGEQRLTLTRATVGTPQYMSPEQVLAKEALTGASDVYSLGVVLYEMLAGRHPWAEATLNEAMIKQVGEALPPIRRYREDIPDDLERLLQKCLEKDKAHRPKDGAALRAELNPILLRLEMEALQAGPAAEGYQARVTGTGLFYSDAAALAQAKQKRQLGRIAREALARLRDPHKRERRALTALQAEALRARDRYRATEKHLDMLRQRLQQHEGRVAAAARKAQAAIGAGNADEADAAAAEETRHQKSLEDYRHQVAETGRQAAEEREIYDQLRARASQQADDLAIKDSTARRLGRRIPEGAADPELGRRALMMTWVAGAAAAALLAAPLVWWLARPHPLPVVELAAEPPVVEPEPPVTEPVPLPPPAIDLETGLVLYYSFDTDESGRVTDRSGKGHDGRAKGPVWSAQGVRAGAMRFRSTNDFIEASDAGLPEGDAPRTIAWWATLDILRADPVAAGFLTYGTPQPARLFSTSIDWRLGRDCLSLSPWGWVYLSNRPLTEANHWYHFVLIYRGNGRYESYVDGQRCDGRSESSSALQTTLAGNLRVGAWAADGTSFRGLMDELRVYDRALTSDEVRQLYRMGSGAAAPAALPLVAAKGGMIDRRGAHGAVLLSPNELFLIGGQTAANQQTERTELFELKTTTAQARAPLNVSRHSFSTTPLSDGRVLIVGGYSREASFLRDAEVYDPKQNRWAVNPTLHPHGVGHTATRLEDGRVLVTGGAFGSGSAGISDRVEVFDPKTSRWSEMARLPRRLYLHSATLLKSGLVLIAGGSDGEQSLPTTFLYDAKRDRWQELAGIRRFYHGAVRLADGRVLVAGGTVSAGSANSAEIFDPETQTWRAAAPMGVGRYYQTMTLLGDGAVLVTGGAEDMNMNKPLASCELYDPRVNAWTPQAPLERIRCTASATLLADGRILIAGGQAHWEHWTSVEFYSPGAQTASVVAAMLDPRTYHAAVLMNDSEVFLVAGQQGLSAWCDKTEGFDLKSGTSRARAPMHIPRGNFSLTPLADGRLLVVGGFNRQSSWLRDAEVYDPKRDTWTAVPPLAPHGAANAATLLADGRVLVAGGSFGSGPSGISDHTEIFDPRTLAWTEVARLPRPLVGHSATLLQSGEVLIAGGNDGVQELATTFLYDPAQNRWQDLPGTRRASHMAVRLADGRVLVTGGHISGSSLGSAELFDPATRTWQAAAPMRTVRMAHTMTLLKDGKVLVTGGADRWELTRSVAACELYDPVRNTWTEQAPLEQPRCMHTATLLPDGRIFLAGGHQGNFEVSTGVEFYSPGAKPAAGL